MPRSAERRAIGSLLACVLFTPVAASAQAGAPDPAAALAESAPPAIPSDPSTWRREYERARERLVVGDFRAARLAFRHLSTTAPGDHERALATELSALAEEWDRRGFVFVRHQDFNESSAVARARNERTTDEIAVLYLNALVYGVGTGGWLAAQTEPTSPAGAILPALGLAGASAGLVYVLDAGRPLHYGVPQSIVSGMYLGLSEGLVWTLWNQAQTDRADEWSGKTMATMIWGSATLGAVAGGAIGSVAGTTPGRASYVSSAGLWAGLVSGLVVASLHAEDYAQDDAALLGAGIGMNAGVLGGVLSAGPVSPSIGRVRFLDLGALAGGLTFGGLYLSAAGENSDGRAAAGASALGIATGLGVAWVLTNGMEPDRGPEARAREPQFHPTLVGVDHGLGLGVSGVF